MASIVDYALISQAVYEDNPSVAGWTRTAFRPSGSGLTDAFQGATFSKSGQLVFAFKGTSGKRDVAADLKLGVCMNSSQFSDAEQFVQATGIGSATQVTLCGHSLGGAIAQIVGNRERIPFVTFNAPGVALMSRNIDQMAVAMLTGTMALRVGGSLLSMLRHPSQGVRDIGSMFYHVQGVNFRLGQDVVGSWGVHYGQVIEIPYSGGALDVKKKHSIDTVVLELRQAGYDKISLSDVMK